MTDQEVIARKQMARNQGSAKRAAEVFVQNHPGHADQKVHGGRMSAKKLDTYRAAMKADDPTSGGRGKSVGMVNGYPIHFEAGVAKPFYIYPPSYAGMLAARATKKEALAYAKGREPAAPFKKMSKSQMEKQDWQDKRQSEIASGAVRKAVRGH